MEPTDTIDEVTAETTAGPVTTADTTTPVTDTPGETIGDEPTAPTEGD